MFLDLLRSSQGAKLLRVKGLVALAEDPEHPVVIHGVQHVIHVPAVLAELAERRPAQPRSSSSSTISIAAFVETLWDAFLGRPAQSTRPTRAALTRQPALAERR